MKPEEQRFAIAKACGWVLKHQTYAGGPFTENGHIPCWCFPKSYFETEKGKAYILKGWHCGYYPHDYLNDLDAMYEAEEYLIGHSYAQYWEVYVNILDIVLGSENKIHATAAQRAEAFLKALTIWKE